jgi:hypothetical protein
MFTTASENRDYAVKPMNCPCHIQIFNQGLKSYRDLPLRMAEFGSCHRNEPSGTLHGLMRVRNFVQDDAHIFCTEEQIQAEVSAFMDLLFRVYADFGFNEVQLALATRPEKRVGSDEVWDKAEKALELALNRTGLAVDAQARRRALLRPQDRVRAARLPGSTLAMRHHSGGLFHAWPAGCALYRRGRRQAGTGHVAPGDSRLVGAVHRHSDRAVRRRAAGLAGAGAGGGAQYHRPSGRLCRSGRKKPYATRFPRRR